MKRLLVLVASLVIACSVPTHAEYNEHRHNPYKTASESLAYEVGYDNGYFDGQEDGYDSGLDAGHENGYPEGESEGYENGYKEGYDKGRYDMRIEQERHDSTIRILIFIGGVIAFIVYHFENKKYE